MLIRILDSQSLDSDGCSLGLSWSTLKYEFRNIEFVGEFLVLTFTDHIGED